ncbi:hypothetical protein [Psychroserpens mesophilus]|uniref:hypothetical protein n=1 Tax=Psychroserpens mesophilus TaxID=325473 RepID=UPI003D6504BE
MLLAEIQHKIQNARHLDFGQIFSESIELFKKVWVQGLITVLLSFGLSLPLIFIITIPMSAFGMIGENNQSMADDILPLMFLVVLLVSFVLVVGLTIVLLGLKTAFYRIMFQYDMNMLAKEDYFYFLKRPYLGKTISLAFAYLGIILLAMLLCYLPIIYVMVPVNLLFVIYAFNPELTVSNLLKLSFKLGNKKWFITFGLTLIAGILAQTIGFLMCFVGIFATASFVSVPLYIIYKQVIGFEHSEIAKIDENTNL